MFLQNSSCKKRVLFDDTRQFSNQLPPCQRGNKHLSTADARDQHMADYIALFHWLTADGGVMFPAIKVIWRSALPNIATLQPAEQCWQFDQKEFYTF